METFLETARDLAAAYALRVIGAIVFLVLALIVAGWAKGVVQRLAERRKLDATVSRFLASLVKWCILLLTLIATLGIFGVETTSFAAAFAGLGLAIGLALQGSLSSVAAGVMLLIFRPFKAGDLISTGGVLGVVDAINLFATTLDTPDNRRIIVPNGTIFGNTLENLTHHPVRRVDIPVGVAYEADPDRTREVLEKAAGAVAKGLADPRPQIILLGLGDSAVNWQVRIWSSTSDYWDVLDAGVRQVKLALGEAGISIPFPQLDVHFDPAAKPKPPSLGSRVA